MSSVVQHRHSSIHSFFFFCCTRPFIGNNLWSVLRWPIKDRGQSASSNQLSRYTRSPALRYSINLAGRQRKINCRESSGCPIVRAGPGSVISANMVEAFCATWKLVDSKNFDDYMKALGEHVYLFFSPLNYNCLGVFLQQAAHFCLWDCAFLFNFFAN